MHLVVRDSLLLLSKTKKKVVSSFSLEKIPPPMAGRRTLFNHYRLSSYLGRRNRRAPVHPVTLAQTKHKKKREETRKQKKN
jgi:hypothetical protein